MNRAFVIDETALNELSRLNCALESADTVNTLHEITAAEIKYVFSQTASPNSRLLIISGGSDGPLGIPNARHRSETLSRIVRSALSHFWPGMVKMPPDWRLFHTGSLLSFQANRQQTGVKSRVYVDKAPEGTSHVFAFRITTSESEPLSREHYDGELFIEAVLGFTKALENSRFAVQMRDGDKSGPASFSLTEAFLDSDVSQGLKFSFWRDAKLSTVQRSFFDAEFAGPLRLKGAAGTGKTLALTMKFLKEIYFAVDSGKDLRTCFLAHGEETVENIRRNLMQIDERAVLFDSASSVFIEITTLHGLANQFINTEFDNLEPLSLDGNEGRRMQQEVIEAAVDDLYKHEWNVLLSGSCSAAVVAAMEASKEDVMRRSFCYRLADEFSNVLETFGARSVDEIAAKYQKLRFSGQRSLTKNAADRRVVLEIYRFFRRQLSEMNVISLDQFTTDFAAYLNSFRWETLRATRGYDQIFIDEMHLFNSQERNVIGYLLRDQAAPQAIAVAYDPRQSPRNTFFPNSTDDKRTVWNEIGFREHAQSFELRDVFRYTPEILTFLAKLNAYFPVGDLAEDWQLEFGSSVVKSGETPTASSFTSWAEMLDEVKKRALSPSPPMPKGERLAILCLDASRFEDYKENSRFKNGFTIVTTRDDLELTSRFHRRPILALPEYVVGLQFDTVLMIDANVSTIAEAGGGITGLHQFVSSAYLAASRAKARLEIFGDLSAGGFAEPIRDAIRSGVLKDVSAKIR